MPAPDDDDEQVQIDAAEFIERSAPKLLHEHSINLHLPIVPVPSSMQSNSSATNRGNAPDAAGGVEGSSSPEFARKNYPLVSAGCDKAPCAAQVRTRIPKGDRSSFTGCETDFAPFVTLICRPGIAGVFGFKCATRTQIMVVVPPTNDAFLPNSIHI